VVRIITLIDGYQFVGYWWYFAFFKWLFFSSLSQLEVTPHSMLHWLIDN
jgi:hypothetical protein